MSGKSSGRVGKAKPKGNFVDAWSYLGMDEFVSPTGMVIKKKVEEFATRLNPTVSHKTVHLIPIFMFSFIPIPRKPSSHSM